MSDERRKLTVEIDNLTEAQAIALKDLFAVWMELGGTGASRWTAFFADGDGNFGPKILVDGVRPQKTLLGNPQGRWRRTDLDSETYCIDFDEIAWALRAERERVNKPHIVATAERQEP